MHFLGISLRKPSFNEITASAVMAVGLWIACVGVMRASGNDLGRMDAGAALLVLAWGCMGARLGINVGAGPRHLVANVVVASLLLGVYQIACTLLG